MYCLVNKGQISVKSNIIKKLSKSDICEANFIPPANGASLGDKLMFMLSSFFFARKVLFSFTFSFFYQINSLPSTA
jgi:hypothetical protein